MVASDGSGGKATHADPTVVKAESEEATRVVQALRGRDGVAQVLDYVQHLGLLGGFDGFHLGLPLLVVLLDAVGVGAVLVGSAEHQLALLGGGLVQVDQGHQDGEPDAEQPALASLARHPLQVPARQELHLDQHRQVVEEPVESKREPRQNLQVFLEVRQFARSDLLHLHVLVEGLEQPEQLARHTHVL